MNIINLVIQVVKTGEFTGILLIDNIAKDFMGEERMATECEMALMKNGGKK